MNSVKNNNINKYEMTLQMIFSLLLLFVTTVLISLNIASKPENWQTEDQYLFGRDLLVAPVVHAGQRQRDVWLPDSHQWIDLQGKHYQGGQRISVAADLATIPVFIHENSSLIHLLVKQIS